MLAGAAARRDEAHRSSFDDGERLTRVQCARVARHVLNRNAAVVGLMPAGEPGPLAPLALGLAALLHEITGGSVATVEAHDLWGDFEARGDFRAEGDFLARGSSRGTDAVALAPQPHGFAAAAALERAMPMLTARYDRVLVDLTGLEKLTGVGALVRAVSTFAIVAGPGRSRRPELLRLAHSVPAARLLGVILYG